MSQWMLSPQPEACQAFLSRSQSSSRSKATSEKRSSAGRCFGPGKRTLPYLIGNLLMPNLCSNDFRLVDPSARRAASPRDNSNLLRILFDFAARFANPAITALAPLEISNRLQ